MIDVLVLVPFYRGAVVFYRVRESLPTKKEVLVPFYRGAVVFLYCYFYSSILCIGSRPLLSRSGCIYYANGYGIYCVEMFSSPFIEERLYFMKIRKKNKKGQVRVRF